MRLSRSGEKLYWFLITTFVVVFAIAAFLGTRHVLLFNALRERGRVAHVQVEDLSYVEGKGAHWSVRYTLDVPGYARTLEAPLSECGCGNVRVGSVIPVTYMPEDPARHVLGLVDRARAAGERNRILAAIGLVEFLHIVAVLAILADVARQRELLAKGTATVATIESNEPSFRGQRVVAFRFLGPRGEIRVRVATSTKAVKSLRPGDEAVCLYPEGAYGAQDARLLAQLKEVEVAPVP